MVDFSAAVSSKGVAFAEGSVVVPNTETVPVEISAGALPCIKIIELVASETDEMEVISVRVALTTDVDVDELLACCAVEAVVVGLDVGVKTVPAARLLVDWVWAEVVTVSKDDDGIGVFKGRDVARGGSAGVDRGASGAGMVL